jgi:hypothetical protein
MMVLSGALTASGTRRLSPIQWHRDGCHGFDVQVREDVPIFDEGMVRRALLRGSLVSEDVDGLRHAITRQLWLIGYKARVQSDSVDGSVVVQVSKSRG